MHGDILLILLLVVVGVAAFFFGLLYILCQIFAAVARGAWRLLVPRRMESEPPPSARPRGGRTFRVCQDPRCRHVEQRVARFCSQCGGELADAD